MIEKVKRTIEKYTMIEKGDIVCVATSGGVDSVVLLNVLNLLKEELSLKLVVCHLNHNLRGRESERDALFVKTLAKRLGLAFEGKKLSKEEVGKRKGESLQKWAREKRLGFLKSSAKKHEADKIALGHNLDDQAETVIMRLIKGCGGRGLGGILPVSGPVSGRFIRPLIETGREDIERYAGDNGIRHVVDSTNRSLKYLRNHIRRRLIPFIRKHYNPNIKETLARCASILREDEDYLEAQSMKAFRKALTEVGRDCALMDRAKLRSLHPAVLKRVFFKALGSIGIAGSDAGIYSHQVSGFVRLLEGKKPNAVVRLRRGLYLAREYEKVSLSKGKPEKATSVKEKEMALPGVTEVFGHRILKATVLGKRPAQFKANGSVAYFDCEKLPLPLRVRTFMPGDRIQPLGMKGHKKLKDVFIDGKVPLRKRGRVLLVTAGGVVIWAVGLKQSEAFRVGDSTKKVVRLEALGGIA